MTEAEQPTIFVIDDDASVRRSLRRLLRLSGYEVEEFASAADFLRRERPSGTGCVVLDVRMPQMSGPELFEWMSASGYTLPVIFLTAHGDVRTGVRSMKGGAVDFLLKPVDDEVLLDAIGIAVARHAERREDETRSALIRDRLSRLSRREREVMEHVVRGAPNKVIATDLGVTEKTVKVHRHRVMQKMEARSLAELVRLSMAMLPGRALDYALGPRPLASGRAPRSTRES